MSFNYSNYSNGSFSGADMVATIVFPNAKPIKIGELSTATYSVYREKHPVRTLSKINVKGFTKGPRTVAGTLIFTVFERHVVNTIRQQVDYLKNLTALKVDELPPFDIYITMANEYGSTSRINIYGLTIVDEGKVFSVEDMFTENQWSYMARDIVLMDDIGAEQNRPTTDWSHPEVTGAFGLDDLVLDDKYAAMLAEIERLKNERDKAIEEARKKALEKYIENNDPFDLEEIYDEVEEVDPDKVNHPEVSFEHRYFKNGFTETFEWEAKPTKDKSRIIVIELHCAGKSTERMDKNVLDGQYVTVTFELDGARKIHNAPLKDGHVIVEIFNFFEWTPQIANLNVRMSKTDIQPPGGATFVLISDQDVALKNDGDGARFGSHVKFSWALKDGSAHKRSKYLKNLDVKIDVGYYGVSARRNNGAVEVMAWRDAFTSESAPVYNPNDEYEIIGYNTTRWVYEGMVPPTIRGKKVTSASYCKTGFTFRISNVTNDGDSYELTEDDLNDLKLKCAYKIVMTIDGTEYVVDGGNENGNLSWIGTDCFTNIRAGLLLSIDEMQGMFGRVLYITDQETRFATIPHDSGIVNQLVNFGAKASPKHVFRHSDVDIILYDFQLMSSDFVTVKTQMSQSECKFLVVDMTEQDAYETLCR